VRGPFIRAFNGSGIRIDANNIRVQACTIGSGSANLDSGVAAGRNPRRVRRSTTFSPTDSRPGEHSSRVRFSATGCPCCRVGCNR
jgi:hypothetical protein